MSTANTTLKIDHENNATAWWDAAREVARTSDDRGAEVFRRLDRASVEGELDVLAEEAAAFTAWASDIEGWSDGPEHAPNPVLVLEDNGPRYRVEVRGEFGGAVGGWRPAICGTLNQSGLSDAKASTFDDADDAEEALAVVLAEGADEEDTRIVEV